MFAYRALVGWAPQSLIYFTTLLVDDKSLLCLVDGIQVFVYWAWPSQTMQSFSRTQFDSVGRSSLCARNAMLAFKLFEVHRRGYKPDTALCNWGGGGGSRTLAATSISGSNQIRITMLWSGPGIGAWPKYKTRC
ncbi:hypothetical protein MDV099 [Gallid alphaherpesvirus 2]|nr:hypothetical protein MDV085 [Gallid alphaherpesvirus 2]UOW63594.1 hypothetical protein MDV099 [Gallid alphaherpesvirus 2]